MDSLIPDKVLREQVIGVSNVTWWTWRKAGKLPPAIKFGRRYFYRRQDVERWLEQGVTCTLNEVVESQQCKSL